MGVAFTNARVAPLWIADKEGFSKKTALTSGSSIFPVELKEHRRYREGLQTIIAEVGKEVPKAAGLKFEEIANPAIVQKLDKSGFIDGLYK